MGLPFCSRCGAKLSRRNKGNYCPECRKIEEKCLLYKEAFRAKHTVYTTQTQG